MGYMKSLAIPFKIFRRKINSHVQLFLKIILHPHIVVADKKMHFDAGIKMHFFVGNHDMWMKNYFQKELNMAVYFSPKDFEWNGKTFHIAHGDGLGPGDHKYKFIKKDFRSPFCRWLFGVFPPYMGMGLANY